MKDSPDDLFNSRNVVNKKSAISTFQIMLRVFIALLIFGGTLFLPAGRLDWWAGWVLVATFFILSVVVYLLLKVKSPELAAERSAIMPEAGTPKWDTILVNLFPLSFLAAFIVSGLDVRFVWTKGFPLLAQLAALAGTFAGGGLVLWGMLSNPFFISFSRIQEERGQMVATKGPYNIVRHPGYLGMAIFALAVPLMLGSLWALFPGFVGMIIIITRTALEDQMLCKDLKGYLAYTRQVRYRLFPGIW